MEDLQRLVELTIHGSANYWISTILESLHFLTIPLSFWCWISKNPSVNITNIAAGPWSGHDPALELSVELCGKKHYPGGVYVYIALARHFEWCPKKCQGLIYTLIHIYTHTYTDTHTYPYPYHLTSYYIILYHSDDIRLYSIQPDPPYPGSWIDIYIYHTSSSGHRM